MSTYKLNTDRLLFTGNSSGHDGDVHIESSDPTHKIVFTNKIETPQIKVPEVVTDLISNRDDEDVMNISGDNIVLSKSIDFNNMPLLNMGAYDLYSNSILSSNLAGQSAPNNTLDKELDNLTVNVNNNTSRTTGLTTNKIIRSNNSGTIQVGNHDETDFIRNNTAVEQNILGDLNLASTKQIKYNGTNLSHTALSGWSTTQDEIDLNTAKTGVTSQNLTDITANNAKVGVTSQNLSDITANNAKVGITTQNLSDITDNNAKVGITTQNLSDITDNNAKVGVTTQNLSDITDNNAKVGITTQNLSDITDNNAKVGITTQNLSDITDNNAKTGITSQQSTDITTNNGKTGITAEQASQITSSTSNVINLINNKVNKSSPTFDNLAVGLVNVDANGLMTGAYNLVASDIPDIPSTKISTTLSESQIPNLQGSKIVSVIDSSIVPNLSTDKLTQGQLPLTRLVDTVVDTLSDQSITGQKNFVNGCVSGSFSGTQYGYLGEAGAIALKNTAQETGIYFNYESSGMAIKNKASSGLTVEGGDLDIEDGDLFISGNQIASTNLSDSSNLIRNNVVGQNITESITISGGSNLTIVNGTHEARFGVDPNAGHLTITNSVNLSGGEVYKVGNSQISSSNLSNDSNIAKLDNISSSNLTDSSNIAKLDNLSSADLSNNASLIKSGVQQGSINCNGDFFLRDDTTDTAIISYQQSNNNTFIQGTNTYFLDSVGNTTLNMNLSTTNPNIIVNNNSDIARGSVAVFGSITSLNSDITALEALSSTYVNLSSGQTIGGQKQFSNQINIVDPGNNSNLSIIHRDGRIYLRNVDNGSSFVQMISNNFSSKLSSDESTSTLICDKDFNLESGRQYKINNVALSSGNLSDSSNIAKLDSISSSSLSDNSNIAKLDSISSTDLSDSSNIPKINQAGINFTEAVQFSGSSIGVVTDAFNNSIIHNDGKIELDNNTSSANIRLTSTAHVVNISSDSTTQSLKIDNDININSGKKYKIDNSQISSSDLSNGSLLMVKPTIWTKTSAQSIKIQSTRDADSLLFERSDTWYNTTTNVYEEIPDFDGDYSVYIQGETVSSQFGIYFFTASFNFLLRATTNDGDATPQIVLPISVFHHASTHGTCSATLQPIAANNWKVYLTWDSIGEDDTNDILEYTMKLRKNYWG